jgi:heat shock protein 4
MLVKAKEIAFKANKNVGIGNAVLAVTFWFSDSQRKGILNACEIASLNCLKVANESSLVALSYGIFKSAKKLFSETIPVHVMFIDLPYSGYCVSIVGFIQENMNVISTVCERNFSGREFDDIIIEFLADKFQQKTGINVRNNKVAILKLQVAAEKAKKALSPSGVMEANISVECLSDDKDLSCNITRVEFENKCSGLVNKLEAPILECLKQAK